MDISCPLIGNSGNNTLSGGAGNDRLDGQNEEEAKIRFAVPQPLQAETVDLSSVALVEVVRRERRGCDIELGGRRIAS